MKKLHVLLLALLMVIVPGSVLAEETNIYYTNNKGIEMTYEEYNNLVNLGFTEFEIRNLSQKTFNENKNLIGEVVGTAEKYYKTTTNIFNQSTTVEISKDEFYNSDESNGIMPMDNSVGYVETEYKKLLTTIVAVGNSYSYRANLEWKKMPARRSYDIIGVGLDSDTVKAITSPNLTQYVEYSNGTSEELQGYYGYKGDNGVGASFKLPSSTSVSGLSYTLTYFVSKVTTATNVTLNAYGDYSHATSNVTYDQSKRFTVDRSGIYLNSTIEDYYDTMMTAKAVAHVIW